MGMSAEKAIADYRLLFADQGKQISVFRSIHSKLTEVYPFCFSVAANKEKSSFSVSSLFHLMNSGNMETWRHGDMETWKPGDMETWRHGNMET
jgi:hypothetical protein